MCRRVTGALFELLPFSLVYDAVGGGVVCAGFLGLYICLGLWNEVISNYNLGLVVFPYAGSSLLVYLISGWLSAGAASFGAIFLPSRLSCCYDMGNSRSRLIL